MTQDTIQDGQFLNALKHKIRDSIVLLDGTGTKMFQNTTREAHEIRHVVNLLITELKNHGITLETPVFQVEVTDEEIQEAVVVVQEIWATMKASGKAMHPSMRTSTLHPVLAANILTHDPHMDVSHWTNEDGKRFYTAWEEAEHRSWREKERI